MLVHTDAHTLSRSMRENFVPIKCLLMPFPDSPVPSMAWGSLWISEWMVLALRLLFNQTTSHVATTAEAEAQMLRKHVHLCIRHLGKLFRGNHLKWLGFTDGEGGKRVADHMCMCGGCLDAPVLTCGVSTWKGRESGKERKYNWKRGPDNETPWI